MSQSEQKIVQYLNEAHAMEVGLVRVLQSQIAMTPRGTYRTGLEKHLGETQAHAKRLQARVNDFESGRNPFRAGVGLAENVLSQALALGKAPFDLVRGSSGEEKILKNAKDTCATEALEIATYTALENVANAVGDPTTAKLAASIRADEERMLDRVVRELPKLARAVVRSEVDGDPSYDITETGAADAVRETAAASKRVTRNASASAKRTARQARKVPGVARAEGQVKGAVASEGDLAIAGYDELTAEEIVAKLTELSQIDLAKVKAYERKKDNRSTVLSRISTLEASEPWPGYDELTVEEIRAAVGDDDERASSVRSYERAHKNRAGVLNAVEREPVNA
jgi:ferritin-like metal-binding protein YciE